ncbi:MAG: MEDS domain-containing protein, partial [Actinomycetota bacterium]|nr:MEDS domain-containing protein [Actinomycetota bacterium]
HEALADVIGDYVAEGLGSGETVVVVATAARRAALDARLRTKGLDAAVARASGALVCLDADATLARFVEGDRIDPQRFREVIGGLVREAHGRGGPVRVYGEMVARLWEAGLVVQAVELEALWCRLGESLAFRLLCAYPSSIVDAEHIEPFNDVCTLHSTALGPDGLPDDSGTLRAFRPAPDAPRRARRFVGEALRHLDDPDALDEVLIVVGELAGNAVVHAGTPFVVGVEHQAEVVRVTVTDAGRASPLERDAGPFAESGRGLALVAGLAERWGTSLQGHGKRVWAEIRVTRR